jgi:hypothetical protein
MKNILVDRKNPAQDYGTSSADGTRRTQHTICAPAAECGNVDVLAELEGHHEAGFAPRWRSVEADRVGVDGVMAMLLHLAARCEAWFHAKNVIAGGEFITHVMFLRGASIFSACPSN